MTEKEKIVVVLIGIRYAEGPNHLYGCHNDIIGVFNFLNNYYKDSESYELDYLILADSDDKICGDNTNLAPTKINILNTLDTIKDYYEKFIIHYSGHGSYIPDYSNDETDGRDEMIVPYDYPTAGIITDDTLNTHFLQKLGKNCQARMLMDCCNSGTIWDLKNHYNSNIDVNYAAPNVVANVIKLSGCRDDQYSFEVYTAGQYQGAFTYCFLKSMEKNPKFDLVSLTSDINQNLGSGGWSAQTSKLTSSYFIYHKNTLLDFENISEENILLASTAQLKIGKKGKDIQVQKVLDEGYMDISCISKWMCLVNKYAYDKQIVIDQINLFNNGEKSNLDKYNKCWHDEYKLNGFTS
jgi:hypothetical protein